MNISKASERSGLPAKTIRYYEEIDLIAPSRASNGYRDYDDADVHRLQFLHRARTLGFSIDECRTLLSLYSDRSRASGDVKALALEKIAEIDARIDALKSMRTTLGKLTADCPGDMRPDCPILEDLANNPGRRA